MVQLVGKRGVKRRKTLGYILRLIFVPITRTFHSLSILHNTNHITSPRHLLPPQGTIPAGKCNTPLFSYVIVCLLGEYICIHNGNKLDFS